MLRTALFRSVIIGPLPLLLSVCLLACSGPATTEPETERPQTSEAFRIQARQAMASYQEADLCLRDAEYQAEQRFSQWQFVAGGSPGAQSSRIASLAATGVSELSSFPAVLDLFESASEGFSSQLAAVPGVSPDFADSLQLNRNSLQIHVYTELQGDADLIDPAMDLQGKLVPAAESTPLTGGLTGIAISGSQVLPAAGTRGEALLMRYRHQGANLSNRVRVIGPGSGAALSELNLRLESQAPGFSRTSLREIQPGSGGTRSLITDLSQRFSDGSRLALVEQRFVNAEGAGSGIGSFTFTGSGGASTSGLLRTLSTANGRLLMLLAPADADKGPLLFQQRSELGADLLTYNAQGQSIGRTGLDLGAATRALAEGRTF